jgi:hypothetical protein
MQFAVIGNAVRVHVPPDAEFNEPVVLIVENAVAVAGAAPAAASATVHAAVLIAGA